MHDKTFSLDGNWLIKGKISDTVYLRPDITKYIYLPEKGGKRAKSEAEEAEPTQKLITGHISQKININPKPLLVNSQEWQVGLLVFALLILSLVRLTQKNIVKLMQKGITSRNKFRQLFREGLLFSPQRRVFILIVHILIISNLIYQINDWYHVYQFKKTSRQLLDFFIIFMAVFGYITVKTVVVKLSGFIFKTPGQSSEYLANIFFFNTIAALLFIPLLIFSVYVPTDFVIVLLIILASILFIFRAIRGLVISWDIQNYSFYQKFMYFCALEILPVIWIVNVLSG